MICSYSANGAGDTHEIPDGARRLDVTIAVDWGADDLRNTHEKTLPFCSYGHLAKYAQDRADQHDGRTVTEGDS